MFRPGQGRGADSAKIRLPKQTQAPGTAELRAMYEQGQANRGREIELSWTTPGGAYRSYSIIIKFDRVTPHPVWTIYEETGRESKLVWRFETSDFNVILDVLCMLEVSTTNPANPTVPMAQGNYAEQQRQSSAFNTVVPQPSGFSPRATGSFKAAQPVSPRSTGSFKAAQPETQSQALPQAPIVIQQQPGMPPPPPLPPPPPIPAPNPNAPMPPPDPAFLQMFQDTSQSAYAGGGPTPGNNNSGTFGTGTTRTGLVGASGATGSHPLVQSQQFSTDSSYGIPGRTPPQPQPKPVKQQITRPSGNQLLEGALDEVQIQGLLQSIGMAQLTGKLEILGSESIGHIYFEEGRPKDATTSSVRGDAAIKELVTWREGTYQFVPNARTDVKSCEKTLQASIMEGVALLDQILHLEELGLTYESLLATKHKNMTDAELRLMLTKGMALDFEWQREIYGMLRRKRTFTDLLRDKPMDKSTWAPLLFNLVQCGLVEIRPPTSGRGGALEFMGDAKAAVQALAYNFLRPETGIYSFPALLLFLEYEFYRFEAYGWPLSVIIFEIGKRKEDGRMGTDPLTAQAINTAALRIDLVKRPLDVLGHFETFEYALLLPNTKPSAAAFIANRMLDVLTSTPLGQGIDKSNMVIAFGIASVPAEGEDLQTLLDAARTAKDEAKTGTFPIVLARASKRE